MRKAGDAPSVADSLPRVPGAVLDRRQHFATVLIGWVRTGNEVFVAASPLPSFDKLRTNHCV